LVEFVDDEVDACLGDGYGHGFSSLCIVSLVVFIVLVLVRFLMNFSACLERNTCGVSPLFL
jgi:hypothetical protein